MPFIAIVLYSEKKGGGAGGTIVKAEFQDMFFRNDMPSLDNNNNGDSGGSSLAKVQTALRVTAIVRGDATALMHAVQLFVSYYCAIFLLFCRLFNECYRMCHFAIDPGRRNAIRTAESERCPEITN